jgi:hypothetical protein
MADHTASVAMLRRISFPKQHPSTHVRSRETFVMTVFETVSPTLIEPIDSMFCDPDCARWTEESALDRWTNEGGALEESRFAPRRNRLPGITQNSAARSRFDATAV